MKIANIIINNFRNIETKVIDTQKVNALLGHCGTGKSSTLAAIKWGLTGDCDKEDIRYGTPEASIKLTFEDGTSIRRTKTNEKGSCFINDKATTEKAANEFVENKFGCTTATLKSVCGAEFFRSLSKKDLKKFILDVLPMKVSFAKLIELSGETISEEQTAFLKKYLSQDTISLCDIDTAYKTVYTDRKAEKQILKTLQEKAKFEKELPPESKDVLIKRQNEIALAEAKEADYKKNLILYEQSVKAATDAEERKNTLIKQMAEFSEVSEPDEKELERNKSEKQQFVEAVNNSRNALSTIKANLDLFKRTLDSLDKPVCPISEKLICSTDKSGLKAELEGMIKQCLSNIEQGEAFIIRCEEQISKRDILISGFSEKQIKWNNKVNLQKQIEDFIIPPILPKPERTSEWNDSENEFFNPLEKELADIKEKLSIYKEKELADKYEEEADVAQRKVDLYEFAVKFLSVNGVRTKLLEKATANLQKMVDEKADSLKKGFKVSLLNNDGEFDIQVSPRGKDSVPFEKISSGEFILTAYIMMSVISVITGVSVLIIDNLDNLDYDASRQLMILLEADDMYDTIFIAGVDHPDLIDSISEIECQIIETNI